MYNARLFVHLGPRTIVLERERIARRNAAADEAELNGAAKVARGRYTSARVERIGLGLCAHTCVSKGRKLRARMLHRCLRLCVARVRERVRSDISNDRRGARG